MLRSTSIVRHNAYHVSMTGTYCEQHWHGLFQQTGSNWADGTSFVSQCPIAANDSFLYDFQTVGQAGTYWYHSHLCESWVFVGPFRELTLFQLLNIVMDFEVPWFCMIPTIRTKVYTTLTMVCCSELYFRNYIEFVLHRVNHYYTSGLVGSTFILATCSS
jgi:hypothetical protein